MTSEASGKTSEASGKTSEASGKCQIVQQMGNGSELLGFIVAWELNGIKVTYHGLVNAFRDAGLDDSIVRTKLPRHAFASAAKKLSDARVIDRLDETDTDIRFQFTRRYKENGEFEYVRECIMTMSKYTGRVYCETDPDLAELAEKLVSEAMDTYTGANIAGYLRQLFKENADIFSYPRDGGVYLVPSAFHGFLDQVNTFVESIGGRLGRLPIAKGTEYGDRTFRETISASIEKTAKTHMDAVEALTPDNQDRSFASRAKEINDTRYKVECYASYLGSEAAKLLKIVEDAKRRLREKIVEASAKVEVQ